MKKILFSLAAIAALSIAAFGCKNGSSGSSSGGTAKMVTVTVHEGESFSAKEGSRWQSLKETAKTKLRSGTIKGDEIAWLSGSQYGEYLDDFDVITSDVTVYPMECRTLTCTDGKKDGKVSSADVLALGDFDGFLVIPEGVTEIETSAFPKSSTKVSGIKFPASFIQAAALSITADSIKTVDVSECVNMTNLFLGATGITHLNLDNCKKLEHIRVTKTPIKKLDLSKQVNIVAKVPSSAFAHCKNLTEVVLPPNISEIDKDVFKNCTKLTRVVFSGDKNGWKVYSDEECTTLVVSLAPSDLTAENAATLLKDTYNNHYWKKA